MNDLEPSSWNALHADPRVNADLARSPPYQALENTLRNPPAGADWLVKDVHVGMDSQLRHPMGKHEYIIRLARPAAPGRGWQGKEYVEFHVYTNLDYHLNSVQ